MIEEKDIFTVTMSIKTLGMWMIQDHFHFTKKSDAEHCKDVMTKELGSETCKFAVNKIKVNPIDWEDKFLKELKDFDSKLNSPLAKKILSKKVKK